MPNRINLNNSKNNRDAHNFMYFDVIRFVCFSEKKTYVLVHKYTIYQYCTKYFSKTDRAEIHVKYFRKK
jgi:hypothetical protein